MGLKKLKKKSKNKSLRLRRKLFTMLFVITATKLLLVSATNASNAQISISVKLVKVQKVVMMSPMCLLNCTDATKRSLAVNVAEVVEVVEAVKGAVAEWVHERDFPSSKLQLLTYKNKLLIFLQRTRSCRTNCRRTRGGGRFCQN